MKEIFIWNNMQPITRNGPPAIKPFGIRPGPKARGTPVGLRLQFAGKNKHGPETGTCCRQKTADKTAVPDMLHPAYQPITKNAKVRCREPDIENDAGINTAVQYFRYAEKEYEYLAGRKKISTEKDEFPAGKDGNVTGMPECPAGEDIYLTGMHKYTTGATGYFTGCINMQQKNVVWLQEGINIQQEGLICLQAGSKRLLSGKHCCEPDRTVAFADRTGSFYDRPAEVKQRGSKKVFMYKQQPVFIVPEIHNEPGLQISIAVGFNQRNCNAHDEPGLQPHYKLYQNINLVA